MAPSKNFLIVFSPALLRFVLSPEAFLKSVSTAATMAVQFLPAAYSRFIGKSRLPNATLASEVSRPEVNDFVGLSGTPAGNLPGGGLTFPHRDTGQHAFPRLSRNKTGTLPWGMLYVDNRGIAGLAGSASV
jgi:hypothetical protein